MIQKTIAELEARLEKVDSVKEENKAELLNLLSTLKSEIDELSKTHGEQAQSIAGFTSVSAHEAIRESKNPRLVQLALDGLSTSVSELEQSHPKLVDAVNRICVTLSNLGI